MKKGHSIAEAEASTAVALHLVTGLAESEGSTARFASRRLCNVESLTSARSRTSQGAEEFGRTKVRDIVQWSLTAVMDDERELEFTVNNDEDGDAGKWMNARFGHDCTGFR